ncbi:MAG: Gfo/Idh/MocA family oxidoreductase [Sphingomonas sp.]|nr:Gfo/Idh/MocA family oxidoreductase [Sphingomonas sp.]
MGGLHARNAAAHSRIELAWIVDPNLSLATPLAAETGATVASLDTVLADPEVRGVIVASSTDAHLANTLDCLRAGKAVFCEKPLSLSAGELEEAAGELRKPGLPPLFVAFNRRFDPHIAALAHGVANGRIGSLESLHIVNHDPAPPALEFVPRSGGLFKDFTIHDFDLAAWLMPVPIVELFAFASCLIDPAIAELGDNDTAKLVLRDAGGALCMISNSRRTGYGYDQRIEAFGSKGALRIENLRNNAVVGWGESGPAEAAFPYGFPDRYADGYRAELDHFADLMAGKATSLAGFAESLAAIRLADAAAESVRTGAAVAIAPEGC